MNPSIFKAYDVRGRYPEEINEEAVTEIVAALATYFKKGKIIVAHDARLSSPSLYKTVLKTLLASGYTLNPISVGLATTPMLYFLVNKLKAVGGIMVTASHNPKEFNGLKIVGPKATMVSGQDVKKVIHR